MSSRGRFPSECLEDIFRHLNGFDLLSCTLVCRYWNELIGSTRACMEKITFRCDERNNQDDTIGILMDSERKYQILAMQQNRYKQIKQIIEGKKTD